MSNLSKETIERINKEAISYGEYSSQISPHIAYRAGALHEAERAIGLVDTLEWIKKYGPCDKETIKFIDRQLAKYKEVTR